MGNCGYSYSGCDLLNNSLFGGTRGLKVKAITGNEIPAYMSIITNYMQEVYQKTFSGKANNAMKRGWRSNSDGWADRGVPIDLDGDACFMAFMDSPTLYGDVRYAVIEYDNRHPKNGGPEEFFLDVMVFKDGQTIYDRAVSFSPANGERGKQGHVKLYRKIANITDRMMHLLPGQINPKGL